MSNNATTWRVTGFAGGTCMVVALVRTLDGVAVTENDVNRITCTVYNLGRHDGDMFEPVEGHDHVELDLSQVLVTEEDRTFGEEVVTCNFIHSPDISVHPAFPTRGYRYMIRYDIFPVNGYISPIQIIYEAI